MQSYSSDVDQFFDQSIQFTENIRLNKNCENNFASQFSITYLAHFLKAVNFQRNFNNGTRFNILLYCTHGSGWCVIGDRKLTMNPHQYVLIPATELQVGYGSQKEDYWGVYIVHFDGQQLSLFNDTFGINSFCRPMDVGINDKGIEIWEEMYGLLNQGHSALNHIHANFCLYHFLGSFLFPADIEKQNTGKDWVAETIAFMQHMIQEKLSVEEMADRLNLSASYFSTLFRKATGLPPLEYFIQLKLQNACLLLTEKGLKVKEVAEAIGYDDPFHFSRLFKKHLRVSPLAYKSTWRSSNRISCLSKLGLAGKSPLLAV